MTLDEIKPGQECRVVRVTAEGATGQRLMDMGIITGTRIKVIRNAPLVDPFDIYVKGSFLAVRRSDVREVEVELL